MKYITVKSRELKECKNSDGTTNNIYIIIFNKGETELQIQIKDIDDTSKTNLKDLERQAKKQAKRWFKDNSFTNKEVSEPIDKDGKVQRIDGEDYLYLK